MLEHGGPWNFLFLGSLGKFTWNWKVKWTFRRTVNWWTLSGWRPILVRWALTYTESESTLLIVEVLEHWFSSQKKPSFRCVGWDSATFPVLRQRWVFPCIFYTMFICCLSGFFGELALSLKCRWLVWIMTFQLCYASGGKKQNGCRQIKFMWFFKRCCWLRW